MILPLLAGAAAAMAPLRAGIWSDVHVGRVSGDYEGMEVQLGGVGADAATVTACGDGCGVPTRVPITREPRGFAFRPAPFTTSDAGFVPLCHARFRGAALEVACGSEPARLLARRTKPYFVAALRPGVWTDVTARPRSGDYAGVQVRLAAPDATTVLLTICEGGCTPEFGVPIVRTAAGFTMAVAEPMVDRAGRPVTGLPPRPAVARFEHGRLVVVWLHADMVDVLRRRARPLRLPQEAPVLEK